MSIICSLFKETVPETFNDIEISTDTITLTEQKEDIVQTCDASTMTSMSHHFALKICNQNQRMNFIFIQNLITMITSYLYFICYALSAVNLLRCRMNIRMLTLANGFLLIIVQLRHNMINKKLKLNLVSVKL